MSVIKRRYFLIFSASALATLGCTPMAIQKQGDIYSQR